MVVGKYRAEEFQAERQQYDINPNLGIQITVDEMEDNYHRVVDTKGKSEGKFTFTTAESGDHEICFQTNAGNGWFSTSHVKFHLDLVVGHTDEFHQAGTEKVKDLARRIQDLNARLQDIKNEQIFQRVCIILELDKLVLILVQEREADFRNQSEKTNARVVRWTVVQLFVLLGTCAWQLTHLQSFFTKQKLV